MTTSEPQSNGGEENQDDPELTLFAADSLASPSASPGAGRRRRILVGSGPRSQQSFATYDPAASSWRTSQGSLLTEWETYSATWPVSGMTRSGTAYQRRSSVPPIYVDESSLLLPTPLSAPTSIASHRQVSGRFREAMSRALGRWPTPVASDAGKDRGSSAGWGLRNAVRQWPTPTSSDATGGPGSSGRQGGDNLRTAVSGALNPTWVEWLMGFPLGWTDLGPSGTPSSRKSSKSSAGSSSKR